MGVFGIPYEPSTATEAFAENLLQLIDEGRRVATYKLALLLALIDSCAENSTPLGEAPEILTIDQIAEHVVRLYYPQVREYLALVGDEVALRQITARGS